MMRKSVAVLSLVAVLLFVMVAPVFAVSGAGGSGAAFGEHHAMHAQEMGGFTAAENPGMHRGFAGWTEP